MTQQNTMPDEIYATPYETDKGHGEWDASQIALTTKYIRADLHTDILKQARLMIVELCHDHKTLFDDANNLITEIDKVLEEIK